jgi:uncharacterized protein YecE (DUF72 family)
MAAPIMSEVHAGNSVISLRRARTKSSSNRYIVLHSKRLAPHVLSCRHETRRLPQLFLFAVKVPQVITHEKVLVDCDAEFNEFIEVMDNPGDKLGPLLLQFGFFNSTVFRGVNDFLARLKPFLKKLPRDHKFAVEIRNKAWLVAPFIETLREHGVALALIDQSWMPGAAQWFEKFDPITADFTYVRWLGDRKAIEQQTKVWDKIIVDRSQELSEWADVLGKVYQRKVQIYTYANTTQGLVRRPSKCSVTYGESR